jgi:hypothetical protein
VAATTAAAAARIEKYIMLSFEKRRLAIERGAQDDLDLQTEVWLIERVDDTKSPEQFPTVSGGSTYIVLLI